MVSGNDRRYAQPFDFDRLSLVPRDDVMKAAMALLDKIQFEAPEVAFAASAVLFNAFVRRVGADPHTAYQLGGRVLAPEDYHQKANIHGEVLRDFAGIRIKGDRNVEIPEVGR